MSVKYVEYKKLYSRMTFHHRGAYFRGSSFKKSIHPSTLGVAAVYAFLKTDFQLILSDDGKFIFFKKPHFASAAYCRKKGTGYRVIEAFKKYFSNDKMRVVNLPMHSIRPNPYQPRKHFDAISLKELSASIEEFGVIQPISVRRVEDGYEIIAGERRYRAAENIGLSEIPAIIMNADEHKSALLALLENLQREDLCFFEIAEGYQKLIREQGMTQDDLAKKLGKSQSTVANKLRLLRLSPRVKKIIKDFSLTERHARALLNIPDEELQLTAVKTICRQRLNVQQSEELVRHLMSVQKEDQPTQKVKIPTVKDVRIFTNTVKKALDLMRENGVDADMKKTDFDWGVEYVIKVKTDPT